MNEHDDDISMSGREERKELAASVPDWGRLSVPMPPHVGSYYGDSDDGEGAHLRDYWRAIRKRLWLVVGVVLLVTLLAAVYVSRQPDVYVAQTRVQVDLESAGVGASKN